MISIIFYLVEPNWLFFLITVTPSDRLMTRTLARHVTQISRFEDGAGVEAVLRQLTRRTTSVEPWIDSRWRICWNTLRRVVIFMLYYQIFNNISWIVRFWLGSVYKKNYLYFLVWITGVNTFFKYFLKLWALRHYKYLCDYVQNHKRLIVISKFFFILGIKKNLMNCVLICFLTV